MYNRFLILIVTVVIGVACGFSYNDNNIKEESLYTNCSVSCTVIQNCIFDASSYEDDSCSNISMDKNCTCKSDQLKNIFDKEFECMKNSALELACRMESRLSVTWSALKDIDLVRYITTIKREDTQTVQILLNITPNKFTTFKNLSKNTTYEIRVYPVSKEGVVGETFCNNFATLDDTLLMPVEQPPKFNVTSFSAQGYNVAVSWEASPNKTCKYDVMLMRDDINGHDLNEDRIEKMDSLYSINYEEFLFGGIYQFSINSVSDLQKSNMTWTTAHFNCTDFYDNIKICPPLKPTLTEVTEKLNSDKTYNIDIKWEKPKYIPDYYNITLENIDPSNYYKINKTLNGTEQEFTFYSMKVGNEYYVTITAISEGGKSPVDRKTQLFINAPQDSSVNPILVAFIYIAGILLVSIICGLLIYVFLRKRQAALRKKKRNQYFLELENKAPKSPDIDYSMDSMEYDPLEITMTNLMLTQNILGEGAFGIVCKGYMKEDISGKYTVVAVKMLKDNPELDDIRMFKQEIKLLRSVGPHPQIVSLLGFCSKIGERMFMVSEYCEKGDLQNYLREAYKRIQSRSRSISFVINNNNNLNNKSSYLNMEGTTLSACTKITDLVDSIQYADEANESASDVENRPLNNAVFNKIYEMNTDISTGITPAELLSFGRQIAIGMEYLSSNRVVHRDLAARNVLVCSDNSVKIADFGLSRDIYKQNQYIKSGSGKLPIKWMALESCTHNLYTTQSDVWSFGVLLWEIVTLGGNPYPSIPTNRLVNILKGGYRMEKPPNCSTELYNIMLSCWQPNPINRPTFSELTSRLDKLLTTSSMQPYLTLNVCDIINEKKLESSTQYSERYLQPIAVDFYNGIDAAPRSSLILPNDDNNETETTTTGSADNGVTDEKVFEYEKYLCVSYSN